MDNVIKKLLMDILICLETIEIYTRDKKVFTEYDKNFLLQDAVERNLITIGEAISLLLKRMPEIPITNARKMVDARNRLTHGYDEIDNTQIWNILINHLPILKTEVENLINT